MARGASRRGGPASVARQAAGSLSTVDDLLRGLDPPRASVARALRTAIRLAAPGLREQVKWRQPVWSGRADVLVLQIYDDHVNLGLFRGAELASRYPEVVGTGKRLRHVKVPDAGSAARPRLRTIVRAAATLDAALSRPRR